MEVGSWNLDGNADAVEFCPHSPFHHIFAAATYTLEEGTCPSRSGSISLFSASFDSGLELLHRVETVGVFDLKWNHNRTSTTPFLAQADADGYLSVHSLGFAEESTACGAVLKQVCREKVSSSMCLYVDWNLSSTSTVLGLSDGSISTVAVREDQLQTSQLWMAHEYEVWCTVFDTYQPHLLYSGSDDCRFSCWDLRESPSMPVFQNAKSHKMGVCCIAQNPVNSNILLTGSYDEFLRVWDLRSMSKPVNSYSLCLGGGVWRVKYHPYREDLVLAACMHNGFAVVRIGEEETMVVESYEKHGSLAYGADWQRGDCVEDGSERGRLVATCSFYDRLIRVWEPESLMVK
ncbi:diphthine methyltransferase [Iris pallida]|uniref:methylated diphthine methylhydrolase n=1 Tax=Iris pallida TaxID=29817 RepID=A0AAX6F1K6_IRIPA|nr:diphthine methyltransferase [Iris pallida]